MTYREWTKIPSHELFTALRAVWPEVGDNLEIPGRSAAVRASVSVYTNGDVIRGAGASTQEAAAPIPRR